MLNYYPDQTVSNAPEHRQFNALERREEVILFVGTQAVQLSSLLKIRDMEVDDHIVSLASIADAKQWLHDNQHTEYSLLPIAVLCDANYSEKDLGQFAQYISQTHIIPFLLYSEFDSALYRDKASALAAEVDDFLCGELETPHIIDRIRFLVKFKNLRKVVLKEDDDNHNPHLKINTSKRIFDIAFAGVLLILLSPLLLLITLLIKLESRGPIFYISQRAGAGYKIFDFYKFRTMRSDADQMRDQLKMLNTYYSKDADASKSNSPVFFKIKDDPRVTRVGKILRKTSLDELPQLFNVLKGDMSVVGNRPLPLDEGASLTTDRWADRFLAPSGLTGLWQVSKNKDNMTFSERIDLDLQYVEESSFSLDMQILLKTLPAMLQRD